MSDATFEKLIDILHDEKYKKDDFDLLKYAFLFPKDAPETTEHKESDDDNKKSPGGWDNIWMLLILMIVFGWSNFGTDKK